MIILTIGRTDGTWVGDGKKSPTYYPAKSVTLYAYWGRKYNITLVTNGGTVASQLLRVDIGQSVQLPTPDRTGFTFEGWFLNSDFQGEPVNAEDYHPIDHVTLYAKWKLKFPRIRYGSTTESDFENVDCGSIEGHTLSNLKLKQLEDRTDVSLSYAGESVEFVLKQSISCVLFSYAMVLYALKAKVTKYDYRTDSIHEMDADPYTCLMANIGVPGDWSEAKSGEVTIRAGYFYSKETCNRSPVNVIYGNLLSAFGGRRRVETLLQNIGSSLEAAKSNAEIITNALNTHYEGVIVRTGDNTHSFVVVGSTFNSSISYSDIYAIGNCFTVYDSADRVGDGVNFNSSWSSKICDFSRLKRFEVIE